MTALLQAACGIGRLAVELLVEQGARVVADVSPKEEVATSGG